MNTALLLAATAPLNTRKDELTAENQRTREMIDERESKCLDLAREITGLQHQIDLLRANITLMRVDCKGMWASIEENKLEISQCDLLISKINAEAQPEVKGYAPGSISKVEKTHPFTPFWDMMTVRAACRTWFIRHNNQPISSRELARQIGKKKGTVAAVLSNLPEFVSNGDTTWQMSTAFYTSGSMTVGR